MNKYYQVLNTFYEELEKISGYGMIRKRQSTVKPTAPVKIVNNASIQKVLEKNPSLVGTKPNVVKLSDNEFSVGDVTFDTFDSAKSVSDYLKSL